MKNKFLERYKEIFGGDYNKILQVMPRHSIRVNTLKIGERELIKRISAENIKTEKIPFALDGYFCESRFSIGSTPEYLQGYYYIQEAASQLPVQILKPAKNEMVLDMAAAPGGKTTQIAQYMENEGVLIALDNREERLIALRNNLERCGVSNCAVYKKDAIDAGNLGIKFDKILLDAPCSGSIVTDKKWFDKKSIEGFKERSELQKKLLKAAVSVLNENGTIVYSTCSMEPEEDEMVIDWALKNLPIKTERIELDVGSSAIDEFEGKKFDSEVRKCIRIIPYKTNTQPFFIAKLTKK